MKLMNLIVFVFALVISLNASARQSVVPKFFPEFWNHSDVIRKNNCYNYSTNRRTDNFAQPGEASGQMYDDLTCEAVLKAASADLGLVPTKYFPFNGKKDDLLVALVVAPGYDFHWFRRGDDNMWTHKPGGTEATHLDNSGKTISDPEKADRGPYEDFCGYYRITNVNETNHEQNGGYVRIGDMKSLPSYLRRPKLSSVRALVFSGRRDPQIPLQAVLGRLRSTVVGKIASAYEKESNIGRELKRKPLRLSRLGYRGILINDTEGLLFPQNTTVHIHGETLFIEREGEPVQMIRSKELPRIEKALAREIKRQ